MWNRQLDIYGRVKREIKASSLGDDVRPFIPFLYQGQYYDFETKLAYNRFRYYSPETGAYISQDPIGLAGGNPTLYGYVKDSNWWVDVFGLSRRGNAATRAHIEVVKDKFMEDNPKAKHIGGGTNKSGIQVKETYIPPTNKIHKSTKGGAYADLTFEMPDGKIVHINTVDKGNYNGSGMTEREYINAQKIQKNAPNSKVITIGKGDVPGDLTIEKPKDGCDN